MTLHETPLPIGTKITIPTRQNFQQTGNPGPLKRGHPLTREWELKTHGWPPETIFTITGATTLHNQTTRIDEVGETETTHSNPQTVYLARLTPESREIRIHPHHTQTT